jgi:hypothetical protein
MSLELRSSDQDNPKVTRYIPIINLPSFIRMHSKSPPTGSVISFSFDSSNRNPNPRHADHDLLTLTRFEPPELGYKACVPKHRHFSSILYLLYSSWDSTFARLLL